jgi:formylmethanofuran dehydrogenase subunit B|tara:strand:+ start:492 stop:1796 length:1305 start_codon:yes stop_codon:yes gene_type:complete
MMIDNVVCPFCGTLCDDIEIGIKNDDISNVKHACKIGSTKFLNARKHRFLTPLIRKNGKLEETSMDQAIEKASQILAKSKHPLMYGWANTTCEVHRDGVALAEELGAVIDSCTSVCHGPSELAFADVGYPTSTLGEVKNRADLVIYWGANPMHAHPRHLSRYSVFPKGYFRDRGHKDRELIVVDVRKTDTAKIANSFIQINPGKDYEMFSALRTIVNGGEITQEQIAGVSREDIYKLAKKLTSCEWGVIFFGQGLTMSDGKVRNIDNAICLAKDLNRHTKFSIMMLRGHYNVTGFSEVLNWQVGFPFAVDFSRGYPRYNPGETASNDVLQHKEVDAAVVVASDPVAHFPKRSVEYLTSIPLITIDPHWSPTTELSDVVFPCAIAGIEFEGTAYRMDTVPIRMRKVIDPPDGMLTDGEILQRIHNRVKEIKNNSG